MKAQRWSTGIDSSTVPLTSTLDGGWVVRAKPRPLYPRERDPVPVLQEAGWTPGPVWTGAENLALAGIRLPDFPALSESLYRLSSPGPRESKSRHYMP
jgi:hypothetical protein